MRHALLGPEDPGLAQREAPSSIRARFGKDIVMNAASGSSDPVQAAQDIDYFFSPQQAPSLAAITPPSPTAPSVLSSHMLVAAGPHCCCGISSIPQFFYEKLGAIVQLCFAFFHGGK